MADFIPSGGASAIPLVLGMEARPEGACRIVGGAKGISLGGPATWSGDGTFGRYMQIGVRRSDTQGSPSIPSLQLVYPGFWRFRWSVKPGPRTLRISAMQTRDLAPFPSVRVRANPAVGLPVDVTVVHPGGLGWKTVGPVSFTASAIGMLWVELWSNSLFSDNPVYFDHIIAT